VSQETIEIEGVPHTIIHCRACENINPLIEEYLRCISVIHELRLILHDSIYFNENPIFMDNVQFNKREIDVLRDRIRRGQRIIEILLDGKK
jgi:hypothetical protein